MENNNKTSNAPEIFILVFIAVLFFVFNQDFEINLKGRTNEQKVDTTQTQKENI